MSPCVQSRNDPFYNLTGRGGQVEKGADERERGKAGGGTEPGSGRRVEVGECGRDAAGELPTGEAIMEAVSGGRAARPGASECGEAVEWSQGEGVPGESIGAGA